MTNLAIKCHILEGEMSSNRKGSADLSDLEIAAINRERNAEHVSFRKKNDSAPSYRILTL